MGRASSVVSPRAQRGTYSRRTGSPWHYDYAEAPVELIARANALADVAERHGVTLPQAAIAFPLRHPRVSSVAIGMRTAEHVARNADLYDSPVPEALWEELAAQGLLDAEGVSA